MTMESGGRGDPLRGLDLLWGTGQRPSRGPKPGLSLDRIARAAIALADTEGLAALSMRRVAERLGFTTMALYRYVPAKAELLAVMLDTAIGEPPRPDGVARGWRATLALWARGTWAFFHRHPWALQLVTGRRPMGPNEVAWFEAALGAIAGTGLTAREMVDVVALVNGYVRGAAQPSLDWAQAEQRTGVTEEQWRSTYAPLLKKWAEDNRYPTVAGVAAAGAFDEPGDDGPDGGLEFGLQRILDGIDVLVRARSAQADRV